MKIVLDANVIIAAFATRGLCESIVEVCLSEHEILLSGELLDEILKNLSFKIKLSDKIVGNVGAFLKEHAKMFTPVTLDQNTCRDPDDVKILGLAVAGNANYIVTGDKDLLVIREFQGILILNPRSFSELLWKEKS